MSTSQLGFSFDVARCRAILDIGVQDTKATCLTEGGELNKFEMNDKWAAQGRAAFSNRSFPFQQINRRVERRRVLAESLTLVEGKGGHSAVFFTRATISC